MEFNQIRYFLALAETLNFTRAAERCCVSQPALTRAIKLLEEELGGQLLIRNGKDTRLSEMGRDLHASFSAIESARQSLKEAAAQVAAGERGELNIGVVETISPSLLSAFIAEFHKGHPSINLHLHDVSPQEAGDLLMAGDIDVCFSADVAAQHAKVGYNALLQEPLVVALPPQHHLLAEKAIALDDLLEEPIIARRNCAYHARLEIMARDNERRLNIAMTTERDTWVKNMVRAGEGLALIPQQTAIDAGLAYRPVKDGAAVREIKIASVYGGPKSVALRALIKAADAYDWSLAAKAIDAPAARTLKKTASARQEDETARLAAVA